MDHVLLEIDNDYIQLDPEPVTWQQIVKPANKHETVALNLLAAMICLVIAILTVVSICYKSTAVRDDSMDNDCMKNMTCSYDYLALMNDISTLFVMTSPCVAIIMYSKVTVSRRNPEVTDKLFMALLRKKRPMIPIFAVVLGLSFFAWFSHWHLMRAFVADVTDIVSLLLLAVHSMILTIYVVLTADVVYSYLTVMDIILDKGNFNFSCALLLIREFTQKLQNGRLYIIIVHLVDILQFTYVYQHSFYIKQYGFNEFLFAIAWDSLEIFLVLYPEHVFLRAVEHLREEKVYSEIVNANNDLAQLPVNLFLLGENYSTKVFGVNLNASMYTSLIVTIITYIGSRSLGNEN
mgnify:CR=1 FL=1